MKLTKKCLSKSVISILLSLCMIASCITTALIPTGAAQIEGESVGASYTLYYIPTNDNANQGNANYRFNIRYNTSDNNSNTWGTHNMTFTGRTMGGRRIYSAAFTTNYTGAWTVQIQGYTDSTVNWTWEVLNSGTFNFSSNNGKAFIGGTTSVNSTTWSNLTYDTYTLYSSGSSQGDFTWDSTAGKYKFNKVLNSGTTYKFDVYNASYGRGSKRFQLGGVTITSTEEKTLTAYNDADNNNTISVTPTLTAKYYFEWTLNDTENADQKELVANGKLKIIFPTSRTITYTAGSHVTVGTVTGGNDDGNGTITTADENNVVINVSYASGYEYDSANSSLGGATANSDGTAFTFSNISGDKTITIAAKASEFSVTVQAGTGGSITSTTPITGLTIENGSGSVSAQADTQNNYAFVGWTASPSENVTFANAGSSSTTFTATAAATITANFTQDTLFPVTVSLDGVYTQTFNAGAIIAPTLTAATPADDEIRFVRWDHTGDVTLASGSWDDSVISIRASAEGATVTAVFEHVDYVYFYAGLQDSWDSQVSVKVGSDESSAVVVPEYITYHNDGVNKGGNSATGSIPIYQDGNGTMLVTINAATYFWTGIFRVPASQSNDNIFVGKSGYYIDCGKIKTDYNGYGYFVYSGDGSNHYAVLDSQRVTSLTTSKSDYDGDETVTINKAQEKVYSGATTAGHDTFTYSYALVNQATGTEYSLGTDMTVVPDTASIPAGDYKAKVTTTSSASGRITNTCESARFIIQTTPRQSIVNYSAVKSSVSTHTYTYKNGSQTNFNSGDSLRANSTVTLVYTLNSGYTYDATKNAVSATNVTIDTPVYNSSNNTLTVTFTVPSTGNAVTISYTATEITHSITLVKKFWNHNGTSSTKADVPYNTISGAGIDTSVSTGNAPAEADYTFNSFTWDSGVTKTSGDANTAAAISVKTTQDSKNVYLNYREILYAITVKNDGHGTVQRDNADIAAVNATGTTYIGNVTAITLSAHNLPGYEFDKWELKGNSVKATVAGTEYTLDNSTATSVTAQATTTFKFNGTAEVKAVFKPVPYSLSVSFDDTYGTYNTGTKVRITSSAAVNAVEKQGGIIGENYYVEVTLTDGYEVSDISGSGISSTMPTPTSNGNVYWYQYTMGPENVIAKVTLVAKDPEIDTVQINDRTNLGTDAADINSYATYSANETVPHYYLQPVVAKGTATETYSTQSWSYEAKKNNSSLGSSSVNPGTIQGSLLSSIIPTAVGDDGAVTYELKVTLTNAPEGVQSKSVSRNYTISVIFNDTQAQYFTLKNLFDRCVDETTSNSPYYNTDAPLSAYHNAYTSAQSFINGGWPEYNAGNEGTAAYNNANSIRAAFFTAYNNLKTSSRKNTIYVLTQYENDTNAPVYLSVSKYADDEWNHFKMYSGGESEKSLSADSGIYKMTYDSKFTVGNTHYYMYTYEYRGFINFRVWRDADNDLTMDTGEELSGSITSIHLNTSAFNNGFGEYYIDVHDKNAGSQAENYTTCVPFANYDHATSYTRKVYVDIDADKHWTGNEIKSKFGIVPSGSVVSSLTDACTENTSFTIQGPTNKAGTVPVNLLTSNFTALEQGKYDVIYTTKYGVTADNTPITNHIKLTLYVAYDDVAVYVDMNDNTGNPIINFKYRVDANGAPANPGVADAYLPYELELVNGSESVYKYTVKTSKLHKDYFLTFDPDHPLNISYITIENTKYYGENNQGFNITADARIAGEIWFKANSTHLTNFNTISFGSVTNSFAAVIGNSNTVINSGIKNISGTGIVTDEDEVYRVQYASFDPDAGLNKFNYVLKTSVNSEVTINNNTYYFDRWVRCKTPADGLIPTNDVLNVPTGADAPVFFSDSTDLNFTQAPAFTDGDYSYIAMYKLAQQNDTTVRVEVTYEFEDYDTSDGNYVYDPHKATNDASYTKVIKVPLNEAYTPTNTTYASFTEVENDVNAIARANVPYVKSNYFDYRYDTQNPATIPSGGANSSEKKIIVTAELTHIAQNAPSPDDPSYGDYVGHNYSIVVKKGSATTVLTGKYQQTVTLNASDFCSGNETISNPVWKNINDEVLAVGNTYKPRFITRTESDGSITDCQIIKLCDDSNASVTNKSVVSDSFTEVYYTGNGTEMLRHNFYIVDYCQEGELVGGGVLYATGTYNGNTWSYRQNNATTVLENATSRERFIGSIIGIYGEVNGDIVLTGVTENEYAAQTINNVGFRYKPFKSTEDVYHYSNDLGAYLTMFEGTNVNSDSYDGQKLRLFSFMVYDNNGTNTIVVSDGYAEVDRYQPQTQS